MLITIVGCGNMGLIYARAILKYDIATRDQLLLVEKSEQRRNQLMDTGIGQVVLPDDARITTSDLIILAIKPQDFSTLSDTFRGKLPESTVVLSIMAGIRISYISDILAHRNIVRAMPNSPVEAGMGVTGFCANEGLSLEQIRRAESLLSTTGRTVFFDNEEMLDAVTALSGSGPAYFFYLVKHMIEAGRKMGFEESVSALLVKQTMAGAYHLINSADKSLDELIQAVASKGGTTEAALASFENHQVGQHLIEGILEAQKRAKELAHGNGN